MESSQWEGLTVGETWSCPMDGAMLSKSLNQFSVDGWSCVPSLLFTWGKRLPAMQETWVRSLGWEDPLEKEMATHSSILGWRIPWTEKPGWLQSKGPQ